MADSEEDMPFIKNLASSDRKLRTTALTSLQTFLSSRQAASSLTTVDILRLWKGLYYALWMADKPLAQQALCSELADLVFVLPPDAVVPWLRGFWATMAREWVRIDVLRLEKFLLLVRRVVGAGFVWMKGQDQARQTRDGEDEKETRWDRERVDSVLSLFAEWPFSAEEGVTPSLFEHCITAGAPSKGSDVCGLLPKITPVGLKLHVLDIWVDEAEKVGLLGEKEAEDGEGEDEGRPRHLDPESQEYRILEQLNALVDRLSIDTTSTAVRIRSKEALADERLPWNRGAAWDGDVAGEVDGDSWNGFDD